MGRLLTLLSSSQSATAFSPSDISGLASSHNANDLTTLFQD